MADNSQQQPSSRGSANWILPVVLSIFVIAIVYWASHHSAQQSAPQPAAEAPAAGPVANMVPEVTGDTIPSYFATAEAAQPYPPTLPPEQFPTPVIAHAYTVAKTIPGTLAQQPCYCFCYRTVGHHSLLDCYADLHGTSCSVCIQEALLTEKLTKEGRTPAQIREAIIRGDWHTVELN